MNFLGPDESADFTSRLRRQGGTTNAQSQPFQFPSTAPTGNFKPQGITPPGPNHSQQWFGDTPGGGFQRPQNGYVHQQNGYVHQQNGYQHPQNGYQHPQNGGFVPPGPWGGGKAMVPGSEPYRDPITGAQVGLNNPSPMGGGFQRPGGGYDSSGINPGGMYGGPPIQGGPFGPPRPDMTGGPVGDPAYPAKSGGRPWSQDNRSEQQLPGGGYGPYGGYGTPPGNGGIIPPGPHGGGPKGFPGMDGGSEVGSNPDQRPMPIPDPRFPRNQPGMTRNQWQQNRLGHQGPQLPQENPIFPTNGWGSNNQGW